MTEKIQEPQLKVLYVHTLKKIIEKPNVGEFLRSLKLLNALDEYMKSKNLRIVITVSSEPRKRKK